MATEKTEQAQTVKPVDQALRSRHQVTIGGATVAYTATVGTLVLAEEDGSPKASFFYVAYTVDGVGELAERPITFSFNGGPGSSSVWMHLGLLGPRRVEMAEDGSPQPPPYRLVDNAHSLLDKTDLVFIDPVGTGYSRAAPGEEAKQFYGFEADIQSVGEFIRLYTSRNRRWSSPKFLIGESYGTTRAAGLAGFLQQRHGMYLNGIMLISSILNFQTAYFHVGNELPYALFLPTYAATAWYHGRLDPELQADLQATLREVEAFCLEDYMLALVRGASLEADARRQTAERIARYTGLSVAYVEQSDLRIPMQQFAKELLRDRRRTIGRLDSRFTGIDRNAVGERFEYDPSMAAIEGPYAGTLNDYVRTELHYESDLPYEVLAGLYEQWDYGKHQNQYVNVAETLREAMTRNPHLRVFVANGYYDLATPYMATRYTFEHLGLDPSLRGHVSMGYYQAGHMMYIHQPSLAQLKADLGAFLLEATSRERA